MVKNIGWIAVLLVAVGTQAQIQLPTAITVVYRSGGDYRSGGYMGVTDHIDSLTFKRGSSGKVYESVKTYRQRHKYIFKEGERFDEEEAPYWEYGYHNIPLETVQSFIDLLDTNAIEKYELSDTITRKGKKEKAVWYGYSKKNYGLHDYGIGPDADCLCEFYRKRIQEREPGLHLYPCQDKARQELLIGEWLKYNVGYQSMSSYLDGIYVTVHWPGYNIMISQVYPGEFNVSWSFFYNDKRVKGRVLFPQLNTAVFRLLPDVFSVKKSLIEYNDLYEVFRKLLT